MIPAGAAMARVIAKLPKPKDEPKKEPRHDCR